MNTASRICVVFAAAASLLFMAFAAAMRSGGGNWENEAQSLGPDYALTVTQNDQGTQYSISHRTGQEVKKSAILAEVVVAARQKQVKDAQEKLQKIRDEVTQLEPQIDAALKAITADEAGLKVREAALEKQFSETAAAIEQTNREIIEAANTAQQIRSQGQERREEVYQRTNQLELLRNDLFAAKVQHQNLVEEEIRLKELLQRLQRRRQQLQSRIGEES